MPNLSIIIPAHKPNEDIFERVLSNIPQTKDIEVLVVENPESTEFVEDICSTYKVSHIVSPLGANNARNTGVYFAKSNIISLIDDDCLIDPEWINNILYDFNVLNLDCVGGKVTLKEYDQKFPWWFTKPFTYSLAELDYGDCLRPVINNEHLVSANLSFTRDIYNKVGGFNANLGYFGRNMIANDEILFVRDCKILGKTFYDGSAVVEHIIPGFRLTEQYITQKYYCQGIADILLRKECGENILRLPDRDSNYWGINANFFKEKENDWLRIYNRCELAYSIGLRHGINRIEQKEETVKDLIYFLSLLNSK